MLDAELSKTTKKTPEIEYKIPKAIFITHDTDSANDSLPIKLWNFT